jgi:hypothetical protein
VQIKLPKSPEFAQVWGDVLYWTITFTLPDGLDNSGKRSGEIFELSLNAGRDIKINRHGSTVCGALRSRAARKHADIDDKWDLIALTDIYTSVLSVFT